MKKFMMLAVSMLLLGTLVFAAEARFWGPTIFKRTTPAMFPKT